MSLSPESVETEKEQITKLTAQLDNPQANLSRTYSEGISTDDLWHGRMIHINPKMAKLANPLLKESPDKKECDYCIMGKFHKTNTPNVIYPWVMSHMFSF